MSKYDPLKSFLVTRQTQEVPMSFHDIEALIHAPLPPVAFKHRAWWSNNPSNSVMTRAWLDAGYKTERVDMDGRKLVFRRAEIGPFLGASPGPTNIVERVQAALRGTVHIPDGIDITAPTGEVWDAEQS
jgi:hypothetical protein